MDTPNLPKDIAFRIELPSFEGPLDLLLHLIKKHELDILDLPIAFVTERYLHYLQMMQELDLDVASEYLLMAATLAHIKSRSLLPPSQTEEEEEEPDSEYVEDPRAELIRRLLEYQKYKHAAHSLGDRALPGRDVFTRGTPAPKAQGMAPLADIGLFKLLDAFEGILKRVKGSVAFEVTAERISIQERMAQITELLRVRRACLFQELFEADRTRYDVVVTFLALLEMTKLHLTKLQQGDADQPIRVTYALLDAGLGDVLPDDVELSAGGAEDLGKTPGPPEPADEAAETEGAQDPQGAAVAGGNPEDTGVSETKAPTGEPDTEGDGGDGEDSVDAEADPSAERADA